ncbi:MAG: lysoplasmalogenase family protein, partial [Acidimicrobiia bacterium]
VVAFVILSLEWPVVLIVGGVSLVVGAFVFVWLYPHLDRAMVGPVVAYVAVISVMVVTAAASTAPVVILGAVAFYFSDLSVARDRFVAPGFVNRVWGLPLYYGAQLLLAWSVILTR